MDANGFGIFPFIVIAIIGLVSSIVMVVAYQINFRKTYYFYVNNIKISFTPGGMYGASKLYIDDKLVDEHPRRYANKSLTLAYNANNFNLRIHIEEGIFVLKPVINAFINNDKVNIEDFTSGQRIDLSELNIQNDEIPAEAKGNAVYCTNCGTKMSKDAKFCQSCGTKIKD